MEILAKDFISVGRPSINSGRSSDIFSARIIMKLIVGLGNPGLKYRNTRHNLGFMVVDSFAKNWGLSWRYSPDWIASWAKTEEFVIIKPSTFMNKSGEAVKGVLNFFKINLRDLLVIHDDIDLEFGKIRISYDSSSAGHRGVDSVIESLGTFEFSRLRIGLGRSLKNIDPEKYVLEDFTDSEQKKLPEIINTCEEAVRAYLSSGVESIMNRFN